MKEGGAEIQTVAELVASDFGAFWHAVTAHTATCAHVHRLYIVIHAHAYHMWHAHAHAAHAFAHIPTPVYSGPCTPARVQEDDGGGGSQPPDQAGGDVEWLGLGLG